MKTILLALVAMLAFAPLHAASKKAAKASKDPALAETWAADAKTYEGKKVTTYVIDLGDIGEVSSDVAYAVVPVATGTSGGETGAEIPLLVPPAKLKGLITTLAPKRAGKGGAFGGKVTYAPLTATFVTIQGEPALVFGDVTEAAKKTKPSDLIAAQRPVESAPAKPESKSKPKSGSKSKSTAFGKEQREESESGTGATKSRSAKRLRRHFFFRKGRHHAALAHFKPDAFAVCLGRHRA